MARTDLTTQGVSPAASGHRRSRVGTLLWFGTVLATFVVLAVTLAIPAGAAGTSPKAQLQAAAAAMQQVPGYAFSASVGSGAGKVKIAGEYQAPDRIHEVVQIGTQPASELVMIGSEVYAKDTTGKWQKTRPSTGTTSDVRSTFAALQQASGVKQSGKAIAFTLSPKVATSLVGTQTTGKVTGRATVANGQITDLRYSTKANGRNVPVRISYTFTNPAPTVSAPV